MSKEIKNILAELKNELKKIHGINLRQLLLYGSYARDEAKPGSDVDILMVMEEFNNIWEIIQKNSELVQDICLKYGLVISLIPVKVLKYNTQKTPLIMNVKREGILL